MVMTPVGEWAVDLPQRMCDQPGVVGALKPRRTTLGQTVATPRVGPSDLRTAERGGGGNC